MTIKRLGIFVRSPVAGEVKTRLAPPLDPQGARDLYAAFIGDMLPRLGDKFGPTVFYSGDGAGLEGLVPPRWPLVPQANGDLGARLTAAFDYLLRPPRARAVVIGSDSPDLPIAHVARAFEKLKHRDVVLGPAADGGYYLVGLRAPAPAIFAGIPWGTSRVLAATAAAAAREGLSLALVPLWYDVDDIRGLELLEGLCRARRATGISLLPGTERVLESLRAEKR